MPDDILSLGLDVGSSTTKLVLCRLRLEDVAAYGGLPRVAITERKLVHASALRPTPLSSPDVIDVGAIRKLVQSELQLAGVGPQHIDSGAVIITGETATRTNARSVVRSLAAGAGRFVVAAAGPDLEGVLAARGAGAAARAGESGQTIAHVDIGGGTANIAVFAGTRLLGTATLHLGGRMLEWDPGTRCVTRISPPLATYASANGIALALGMPLEAPSIVSLPNRLVATLVRCLTGRLTRADLPLLLGAAPRWDLPLDAVSCSGGVPASLALEETSFTDLGRALARALNEDDTLARLGLTVAPDAGRATVLGAGAQSLSVSGATLHVSSSALPLRNLPVCRVSLAGLADLDQATLEARLAAACLEGLSPLHDGVALYLDDWPERPRFGEIRRLAEALSALPGWAAVTMGRDLAQVLGQCLTVASPGRPIICIDGIVADTGDYLDLGAPLPASGALPVVVKTLAFPPSAYKPSGGDAR